MEAIIIMFRSLQKEEADDGRGGQIEKGAKQEKRV
jgi:hypothetical protein